MSDNTLDDYRYINVEHEWYETHYEYWIEKLEEKGYANVEINFSGFYSQGDGASFVGYVPSQWVRKFMELHGLTEKYRHVYAVAEHIHVELRMERTTSRYSHPYTVAPEGVLEEVYEPDDANDLRAAALHQIYECACDEWNDFLEHFGSISRDYMDQIYKDLYEDYDYLTSDDAVRETLGINDIAA